MPDDDVADPYAEDPVADTQELRGVLPQLTDDVRGRVASYLSLTDRAKCLLLTSSILKQEGTAAVLERLEIDCKLRLRLGQIEEAERARLAAKAPKCWSDLAPAAATRECVKSHHDALIDDVHSMQNCQQEMLEAIDAFITDQKLRRLVEQHLPLAERIAQLCHQVHSDRIWITESQDKAKHLAYLLQELPA